ncbi:hypothetical protein BFV94_4577 [Alteromonas macleodii]|uniref:Glycosyl transferase family 28 C-terminal domain-containing protein n=1 Tax=Alteromonas macleodii TaxID=28108 RepID=A0AB36FN59_ALTMA|nr:hypothetical protein BFV93_4796 [Alteromonas macleodii]OES24828.1 hypothetical protein BFV95_4587 [Alteromonas macleodii]OES25106.1 hypothetical protein BFV94_4577 [Alteromonas macleodii]OES39149.1 hypothetical protein BFV96_4297 [Alteromonas macleodii]
MFYAINGTGMGHISRLNNIAEDMSWLCQHLDIEPRFEFLTTSDAPFVVTQFPTFKLPSKTTIKALGLPMKSTTAHIKTQIVTFLNGKAPDGLILDTNPKGSYQEFPFLRSLAKRTVFIDRARKPESITRQVKNSISLFDRVIVPETEETGASYPFHPNISYAGKIHGFKPENALSRDEVRTMFGVNQHEQLIYLSSGGGGDTNSEAYLQKWLDAIGEVIPHARVIVGYGPLYKGAIHYANRQVIPCTGTRVNQYFAGVDLAISAAGYNSVEELQAAKVPSLFYGLEKGFDDQFDRIRLLQDKGLCTLGNIEAPQESLQRALARLSVVQTALKPQPYSHGSAIAAGQLLETLLTTKTFMLPTTAIARAVGTLQSIRSKKMQSLFDQHQAA